MMLVPVPGYGSGDLSMEGNLAGYVDRLWLPGALYRMAVHDPEGILSTIPAISTALMGAMTGNFLRIPDSQIPRIKKAMWIGVAGAASLIVGWLWGFTFPINKNLWSSSFVLYAGGWSLILLCVFYLIVDVRLCKRWAFFFVVIGMNSITIYMFQAGIINFDSTTKFFFDGFVHSVADNDRQLLIKGFCYTAVCWVFLYILFKKNIFLKI